MLDRRVDFQNCCGKYMSDKDWRCGRYGPLGFIETCLKVIAFCVVAAAMFMKFDPDDNRLRRISVSETIQIVIFGVLSLLDLVLIVQRIMEKEVCAIVFRCFSFFAHVLMMVLGFAAGDTSSFTLTFAILHMWGDYAKFGFLYFEDEYETYLLDRKALFILTATTCALYMGIIATQTAIMVVDYPVQ